MDPRQLGEQIGIEWNTVKFTPDQLAKGIKVEKEHTKDPETQVVNSITEIAKIAWAHLKELPDYYNRLDKMEKQGKDELLESILTKIDNKTVTVEDFNQLIESPESTRNRLRRRMKDPAAHIADTHRDAEGHQQLDLPTFADRIQPKPKTKATDTDKGRAEQGRRRSKRTQARMSQTFKEALDYITIGIGKPINESALDRINKYELKKLATKFMSQPGVDRDWLQQLLRLL